MAKYNSKSVYGTLFTMLDNFSKENKEYLMNNVFDGNFLEDIKSNPKNAYDVLNKVVINIEDGKKDKISELLSEYKDKIYMMKNMLKDYGNFKEKKCMAKYDWKVEPRDEDWSDDTYAYFLIHINLKRMVEYLTKEFKKDWWFKADYGQDNCYIVAENHNFPVRLFFTFDEGGWADITRHYIDGATLKDDHLGSWHFGKYDVDYSYAVIRDNIENYFYKFEESMKEEKKSIKESFEYEGGIPLDELMNILTEEWQENNTNNLLFRESSHWDDSARDENRYIEISAIIGFTVPWASGFEFSNKKVQKDYDKEIESVEKHYTFEDNDDYNKMTDELNEYQPILFIIAIDLKDEIIYADVDLGDGLGSTEVAREKLAENEEDFRKQIQRMIDAF